MSVKAKSTGRASKRSKTSGTPRLRRVAPRGKPFEKGNSHGIATRFAPGVSGNPGGCPKYKKYSDSLRAMVAADVNDKFPIQTGADAIAHKVFKLAKRGNMGAIRELGDRCEGRPAQAIHVDGEGDSLKLLIASMERVSSQIGPPEGWEPRLLEGEVENNGDEEAEAGDAE